MEFAVVDKYNIVKVIRYVNNVAGYMQEKTRKLITDTIKKEDTTLAVNSRLLT